jgi:PKHD-type hydroxylase
MSHSFRQISNNTVQRSVILNSYCFWPNIFSDEEIESIISILDNRELEKAKTGLGEGDSENKMRVSDVHFFPPDNETSFIFERINHVVDNLNTNFFNFDINGYDTIQYTTYNSKHHGKYDFHMDTHLDAAGNNIEQAMGIRKLSVVVLLSDPQKDFTGGQFQMNYGAEGDAQTVDFKKGMMIVFPSFIIHRVLPVFSGIRKTLVTWVTGPKFR